MNSLLKPLASLRLTVLLLALTMVVVFAGTWAQVDQGIWQVQARYFHSFFCWIDFALFWKRPLPGHASIPGGFPMLGGYSIIILLLANLLAAHWLRFKLTRKRLGIIAIHAGLILMLVGELITSTMAHESRMAIDVGQTVSYTFDTRKAELAITDTSAADHDEVVVIGSKILASENGRTITDPKLPFAIRIDAYYPNSAGVGPFVYQQLRAKDPTLPQSTAGEAKMPIVTAPLTRGTDNAIDAPSAFITPVVDGKPLGTYQLSTLEVEGPNGEPIPLDLPQTVDVNGKTYRLQLRWKREYRPFAFTLKQFTHDQFEGTKLDSNFASVVRLTDPSQNEDREVRIWMNHPLRYRGETFYQASVKTGDAGTVLLVVHNPCWLIPYISCVLVGVGMLVHFGTVLIGFLGKHSARTASTRTKQLDDFEPGKRYLIKPDNGGVIWPAIATGFAFLGFVILARPMSFDGPYDLAAFSRVPVNYDGRVMPLDSVAQNTLRILSGKSYFKIDNVKGMQPAIRWLADVFANPADAQAAKVLRIDDPEVLDALGLDHNRNMFSFDEVVAHSDAFNAQLATVPQSEKDRNRYQNSIAQLAAHMRLIGRLEDFLTLYFVPPVSDGQKWMSLNDGMKASQSGALPANSFPTGATNAMAQALTSYHERNPSEFNKWIRNYLADLPLSLPSVDRRVNVEAAFNQAAPFFSCWIMYIIILVLAALSWLIAPARLTLRRCGFSILVLTMLVHVAAVVTRCYIQGRPPVTNLYSAAIFIAGASTLFCIALEWLFKNGIGLFAASTVALPLLWIAHGLAATTENGDTMGMLRAVLDTNIWLATHVVIITLGYAATGLAGMIAIVFIVGRAFGAFADSELRKNASRMIYGVVCFAMLFSFVGTVLGGIWADQSWGRFWGWDPKENGAVLIVLWNAIVLHARWAGLVKDRGVANLAIFGNVVTAWSFFGTNMLGVGLHSYGFMQSGLFWLSVFITLQLIFIATGLVFRRSDREFRTT